VVGDAPVSAAPALLLTPTPNEIWKVYYYAGAQLMAMRVLTGTTGNTLYYLHSDHLGSTSVTTSITGTVLARQSYTPYGSVRSGGGLPTDIGFTGQRAESSGLMYFRARYYSGVLGRFISADSIVPGAGNPQNLNRYAYVNNNPLKYIDPSGHDPCTGRSGTYMPDCGVDGWGLPPSVVPRKGSGDGDIPPFDPMTDLPVDGWGRQDRTERAAIVLDWLRGYEGPNAWWKTNGELDPIKIKAWLLMQEQSVMLGNDEAMKFAAGDINFRLRDGLTAEALSAYTAFFNPAASSRADMGRFDMNDWYKWMNAPGPDYIEYIANTPANNHGGQTYMLMPTEVVGYPDSLAGYSEKDVRIFRNGNYVTIWATYDACKNFAPKNCN
jgi:RHS repeat-associated protein